MRSYTLYYLCKLVVQATNSFQNEVSEKIISYSKTSQVDHLSNLTPSLRCFISKYNPSMLTTFLSWPPSLKWPPSLVPMPIFNLSQLTTLKYTFYYLISLLQKYRHCPDVISQGWPPSIPLSVCACAYCSRGILDINKQQLTQPLWVTWKRVVNQAWEFYVSDLV